MSRKITTVHNAYLVAIAIKGFDGAVEMLLGIIVAVLGRHGLYNLLISLAAPELENHPYGRIAHFVHRTADGLIHASHGFIVFYLLVHGILKLGIAIGLFRERTEWIFPVGSVVLAGFIVYMSLSLAAHWSYWLLAFAIFDSITLALVLNEWRSQHKLHAA